MQTGSDPIYVNACLYIGESKCMSDDYDWHLFSHIKFSHVLFLPPGKAKIFIVCN